jgi:D-amino-acid dehydrogenase
VRYRLSDLPQFLPWIVRYYLASSPGACAAQRDGRIAADPAQPDRARGPDREAGAGELLRKIGWIKLYRSQATLGHAVRELERARHMASSAMFWIPRHRRARAASDRRFRGAIHFPRPASCPIPAGWQSLCGAVRPQGRAVLVGDARRSSNPADAGASRRWKARSPRARSWWRWGRGPIRSSRRSAIRSRSTSSAAITCICKPRGNAVLNHPVLDTDQGFLLAPMNRGIRLTTGVEFATAMRRRPGPGRAGAAKAHRLFPLGEPIDAKPWMGAGHACRTCFR